MRNSRRTIRGIAMVLAVAFILLPVDRAVAQENLGIQRTAAALGRAAGRASSSLSGGGHSSSASQRSVRRRVAGGVLGGVVGFALGGGIGSRLEPDCHCADQGMGGYIIGAQIGAFAGALLGAIFY